MFVGYLSHPPISTPLFSIRLGNLTYLFTRVCYNFEHFCRVRFFLTTEKFKKCVLFVNTENDQSSAHENWSNLATNLLLPNSPHLATDNFYFQT